MIRIKKFNESIESEREIKKFSEDLIPLLAEKVYRGFLFSSKYHSKSMEDALLDRREKGWSISVEFEDVKRVPRFLQDFYKNTLYDHSLILYMGVGATDRDLAGQYSKGTITLYLTHERVLQDIIDIFRKYNQESRIINFIERKLENNVLSTLIHEMTHAYDDYLSSGKYRPKGYIEPEDSWEGYASQNLEVNARYTSTVAKLDDMGIKYTSDFDGVKNEFKSRFRGWSALSDEQQKRIIKRLYAWYTEPIEGKREQKRALKYIYNNAAFEQLYKVGDSTFLKFKNRVKIPDNLKNTDFGNIDVVSYIRESAEQLIDGSYDRKEIKNPSIVRNRYAGFKAVKHLIDTKETTAQKLNQIESENLGISVEELLQNNKIYQMMHKQWSKQIDRLRNMAEQLEVSEDDLYTIAKRFK